MGLCGSLVCLVQVPPFLPTRQSRHFKKHHRNTISGEFSLRSGYCCPSCGHTERIFSPSTGGAQAMCQQMDVPYLGSVPLDGRVAAAGDQGMPLAQLQPDGPVAKCSWAWWCVKLSNDEKNELRGSGFYATSGFGWFYVGGGQFFWRKQRAFLHCPALDFALRRFDDFLIQSLSLTYTHLIVLLVASAVPFGSSIESIACIRQCHGT